MRGFFVLAFYNNSKLVYNFTYILLGGFVKDIFKKIFIILFSCFSFFYTDKVINYINKKDPLMKEISSLKDNYEVLPVDARIKDNTIIPGVSGKTIDIEKSYNNMRSSGIFREDKIIYKYLFPNNSISNNINKFIIKGNSSKKEVSLLYIIDNYNDIDIIKNIDNITIFIDSNYINIDNIYKLKNNEIYTYGNNGIYESSILDNDNAIINRISNNKSIYCLSTYKDNNILNICNDNDMYVVIPSIVGNYYEIKNNICNGSIILINTLNNLDIIIKYIEGKGYNIVHLSKLLSE